jgi:tetratricopeptide (TPR) repeat protein
MTMTANSPANPKPGRGRRRLGVGLFLLVALALGIPGLWFYVLGPQPPEPPLADAGPGVAEDVAEARSEVKVKPFSAAAWGNLGLVLHLYEYYAEAVACYTRAAQLGPRNPRWPYLWGVVQLRSDLHASLPLLERAARLGGQVQTPRLVLGETLLLAGRAGEAEEQFRLVLEKEPENPRALLGLGRVAINRGDPASAKDFLRRSAGVNSRVRITHALLAQVFHQLGEPSRADQERALAAKLPEKTIWPDPYRVGTLREVRGEAASVYRATALEEQGRGQEAVELLQEALRRHPQSARARRALGRAYFLTKQYAAADRAYREAVRLKPDSLESQFEWGVVLEQRGDFRAAAECLRQALRMQPHYGEAHYHLGRCFEMLGDEAGALAAYRGAVRYQPDLAAGHQALGALLALKHRDAEAQEILEYALRLDPSHEKTRRWLEIVRQQTKSPDPRDKPR